MRVWRAIVRVIRRALGSGPGAGALTLALLFGLDFVGATLDFMGFSDEKATVALEQMEHREKPFLLLPVLARETRKVVGMIHLHDIFARGL